MKNQTTNKYTDYEIIKLRPVLCEAIDRYKGYNQKTALTEFCKLQRVIVMMRCGSDQSGRINKNGIKAMKNFNIAVSLLEILTIRIN